MCPATISRPKTAGRNSERPPTTERTIINQRPVSRKEIQETDYTLPINQNKLNSASFSSLIDRQRNVSSQALSSFSYNDNALNNSFQRQVRTAATSNRVSSSVGKNIMPPGTGHRPITQQGVSGAQTSYQNQIGSTFGNRQVADKTYFISLLNTKLKLLQNEINSLTKELEKTEKGRKNLLIYEQNAEEQANEFKKLQTELLNLNLIIDCQNTNSDLNNIKLDLNELKIENQQLEVLVEELFRERREKEQISHELELKIQQTHEQNLQQINNLDKKTKNEINKLKQKFESLNRELEIKQEELDDLNKIKEKLDLSLTNLPLKQQAMMFQEQIFELEEKKQQIFHDLNLEITPEAQLQLLIQQIQKDNEEVSHMQLQIQEITEQISQAQEEVREFANDFELHASDKSERFRELRLRDSHINAFLDSFDESKLKIDYNIKKLAAQVVKKLRLISANCHHSELISNVATLDESTFIIKNEKTAEFLNTLQSLHIRLQKKLNLLQKTESQLISKLELMQIQQEEIDEKKDPMKNIEIFKQEAKKTKEDLKNIKQNLNKEFIHKDSENVNIIQKIAELEQTLNEHSNNNNQLFTKFCELKRHVDFAEEEKSLLLQKYNDCITKNDYKPIQQQVLRLCIEYNALLTST